MANNSKMFTHKEEVLQMWEDGFSVDEIARKYGVTLQTAQSNLKVWGVDITEDREPKPLQFAKPKPFKAETFMVNGKKMVDVTQFMVDCGG